MCRTTLTVTTRRSKVWVVKKGLKLCGNVTVRICERMEESLSGTTWNIISPLLTTDEAVRCRTVAKRWNVGSRSWKLGKMFFQLLHNDPFAIH